MARHIVTKHHEEGVGDEIATPDSLRTTAKLLEHMAGIIEKGLGVMDSHPDHPNYAGDLPDDWWQVCDSDRVSVVQCREDHGYVL